MQSQIKENERNIELEEEFDKTFIAADHPRKKSETPMRGRTRAGRAC